MTATNYQNKHKNPNNPTVWDPYHVQVERLRSHLHTFKCLFLNGLYLVTIFSPPFDTSVMLVFNHSWGQEREEKHPQSICEFNKNERD